MVKKLTKFDVLALFLEDYSKSLYLREIASLLGTSHQAIKPRIEKLVADKILDRKLRKKITDYSLNFRNALIYSHIAMAEQERTTRILSKSTIMKRLYELLSGCFKDNTFVVFGSAAVNVEKANDIDLLCVGNTNIKNTIKYFNGTYSKTVHLVQVKRWKELQLSFIKEIYSKHILLNDTEKVVRIFGEFYEQHKLV